MTTRQEGTMSRDIHNQRLMKLARTLPGRADDTDTSRGYVGWGPGEDATCAPGRSVEHADWDAFLGATQTPPRAIHDFYFGYHEPTEECACCAGSGRNRTFAELSRGFYRHNGGRWAGWGEGRLHQEEVDELVRRGRVRAPQGETVTPDNLDRHLGRWGHDGINHWILVPIRARILGIDTADCFECVGTGRTPTGPAAVELHVWTFDATTNSSRVDTVLSVGASQVDEIREHMATVGWDDVQRRFGWATNDNMHPELKYESDWRFGVGRTVHSSRSRGGWWDTCLTFETWDEFARSWPLEGDPDLNLVHDYRIVAPADHADHPFASSELPEVFGVQIWMSHPRKGADKMIAIKEADPSCAGELKELLRRSHEVHGRHFAWAVGRKFGNEREVEPREPEEIGGFRF